MLKLNIPQVANLRGINHVFSFLRKIGISHNVANRYTTAEANSISFKHLTEICIALNCTPNDIIEYIPDRTQTLPENHPLNALIKNNKTENFKELLKTLPIDKINEIARILSEQK